MKSSHSITFLLNFGIRQRRIQLTGHEPFSHQKIRIQALHPMKMQLSIKKATDPIEMNPKGQLTFFIRFISAFSSCSFLRFFSWRISSKVFTFQESFSSPIGVKKQHSLKKKEAFTNPTDKSISRPFLPVQTLNVPFLSKARLELTYGEPKKCLF